ncbi:hypothetical protein SS1G_10036 [Sclerotinia sclerotiorum 1980 UF-70]|uniref:Uncharacterized protein n=1 Tax=Sclerotinia sclerotiorum (strain ATCC 18683 / 1980 / Ss-1) TaxID=665079 RepID=A7EXH1_SCLS1|nr:hypothetical protein SS1G_10036 [Sclerotinia sclerotiorum 1980 UF-70]EDN94163.1 hypothetical protein SS1G_10036 [Sclerotinia sclerotiorum 1980 UF-70]
MGIQGLEAVEAGITGLSARGIIIPLQTIPYDGKKDVSFQQA